MTVPGRPDPDWSARSLRAAVASGARSPQDVAREALERIAAADHAIAAFSDLDPRLLDHAAALARELDSGRPAGPLAGVPVAVKDYFDVAGLPTRTAGAGPRDRDSAAVVRLRAAGALVVGKTWTPVGTRMPPTRNPWDPAHGPGGSSSGAAAAVAACLVPVALAEQTAGSILRPASFCGVVGFKPSHGAVDTARMYASVPTTDDAGVIADDTEDAALMMRSLATDPRLVSGLPWPEGPGPAIGYVENHFPELAAAPMRHALDGAANRLAAAGARVVPVRLPDEFALAWHAYALLTAEAWDAHPADRSSLTREDAGTAMSGTGWVSPALAELVPATAYLRALRIRRWLAGRTRSVMREVGVDALLTPAAVGEAPAGLHDTGDPALNVPWSFLGFPALSVPAALSPAGLPLGIQLASPPGTDDRLLALGGWVQSRLVPLPAPPLAARPPAGLRRPGTSATQPSET